MAARRPLDAAAVRVVHALTALSHVPADLGPRRALCEEVLGHVCGRREQATLFLSGNPASGKTTVIERIRADPRVRAVYVNAALFGSPQQIFVAIYRQLRGTEARLSLQRAYELLRAYRARRAVTLIVDEVDYLTKRAGAHRYDQVYQLLELRQFNLVFVANSLNFIGELSRVHSRLAAMQSVAFSDYTADEMVQMARIRLGAHFALVDEKAMRLLAQRCAAQADLRRFLVCVYKSFRVALERGAPRVEVADVHRVSQARRGLAFLSDFELHLLGVVASGAEPRDFYTHMLARLPGHAFSENDVIWQLEALWRQNVVQEDDGKLVSAVSARGIRNELDARAAPRR